MEDFFLYQMNDVGELLYLSYNFAIIYKLLLLKIIDNEKYYNDIDGII